VIPCIFRYKDIIVVICQGTIHVVIKISTRPAKVMVENKKTYITDFKMFTCPAFETHARAV